MHTALENPTSEYDTAAATESLRPPRDTLIESALWYAKECGFYVFPVRKNKKPYISDWQRVATQDEILIRNWWEEWPDACIGVACGLSGILALDFDLYKPGGRESAFRLKSYLELVNPDVRTGRGGEQFLFRCDDKSLRNSASKLILDGIALEGVDIRAGGGYVIVPPSESVFGVYERVAPDERLKNLGDVSSKLVGLVKASRHSKTVNQCVEKIPEGCRNSTLASIAGSMRCSGLSAEEILSALLAVNSKRCVPPLVEEEVATIASSVGRYAPGLPSTGAESSAVTWDAIPVKSIQAHPPLPVEWDIGTLLQSDDGPACWFGDSGSYKSFLALHIAWCLSTGEPVFGEFATKKRDRITYVNIDAGKDSFARRVCRLPKTSGGLYVVNADSWNEYEFECLLADNYGCFVILDCWTDIYDQPANEDMAHHMRQRIKYFRDKFAESGANGIVIDHSKRNQSGSSHRGADLIYGSTQKKGTWRQMILVEKLTLAKFVPGSARVKVSCVKMSEGEEFKPFYVDLTFGQGAYDCKFAGFLTTQDEESSKAEVLREQIVGYLKVASEPAPAAKIAKEIGTPRNSHTFTDALTAAKASGLIRAVGNGKNTKYVYTDNRLSLHLALPEVIDDNDCGLQCNATP